MAWIYVGFPSSITVSFALFLLYMQALKISEKSVLNESYAVKIPADVNKISYAIFPANIDYQTTSAQAEGHSKRTAFIRNRLL